MPRMAYRYSFKNSSTKRAACSLLAALIIAAQPAPAFCRTLARAQQQAVKPAQAEQAFREGERLSQQQSGDSLRSAIKKYSEALEINRRTDDRAGEAVILHRLGRAYERLSDAQRAFDHYAQSLALFKALRRTQWDAVFDNLAPLYSFLGGRDKALEFLVHALPLVRALRNWRLEATMHTGVAKVYTDLNDPAKALDHYDRALMLFQTGGDEIGEGDSLAHIGDADLTVAEKQKAIELLNKALPIIRLTGDKQIEGIMLFGIGYTYLQSDEMEKAITAFEQALALQRAAGDRDSELYTLTFIGHCYRYLGEAEKSLQYQEQALSMAKEIGNRKAEAATCVALAHGYLTGGDNKKALEHVEQGLAISRAVKDQYSEANALMTIAAIYERQKEYPKALDHMEQSLQAWRAFGYRDGEALALSGLGSLHYRAGNVEKALDYIHQSVSLYRTVGDLGNEAIALYLLAVIERDRDNLAAARSLIESAIEIIESIRARIKGQEFRVSYLASNVGYYEFYIDLLMRLHRLSPAEGFAAAALQAAERARARSLLDMLIEARADIRRGADPRLLERERILQQDLAAKTKAQIRLLSGKHNKRESERIEKELQTLSAEYQKIQAQIRAASPHYAALTQPQPLSLKEIQQQALDRDTLLLEYSLGAERSYLWAVTQDSISSFELPSRDHIEAAAKRLYESLSAPAGQHKTDRKNRALRVARASSKDESLAKAAAALAQMVLAPAAKLLGKKRLLVVADGALQYVPFAVLPDPAVVNRPARLWQPLILDHEIVSAPSASALAVLRKEIAGRAPAPKTLGVLADPVFDKNDERVKALKEGKMAAKPPATVPKERGLFVKAASAVNSVATSDDTRTIPQLPGTRAEAEQISKLVPEGERLMALDFGASREVATSDEIARFRFLHFATHGFLNSSNPELSGVVLSMVDQNGNDRNGLLLTPDVFNLRLPAELVVLSACQTGLGKQIKGEGLVGLTRGFMYAGAARVVVSLWSVDDEATKEMMVSFYGYMLNDGMRPAAALRSAQIDMWRQERWKAPYYWAAFVLQGEWK